MEAAKARADAARAEHDPEPPQNEESNGVSNNGADLEATQEITTNPDSFNVFWKYTSIPSHNPGDTDPFSNIPSASPGALLQTSPTGEIGSNLKVSSIGHDSNPLASSKNPSEDILLGWWSEGSSDGIESLNRLVKGLKSPFFNPSQLEGFDAVNAMRRFEKEHCTLEPKATLKPGDGWKTGSVTIRLPCTGVKQREEDAPVFTVDGILYRDVVKVITRELEDPDSFECIHIQPFEEWWNPSESDGPIRVYSDIYTSNAMLEADKQLWVSGVCLNSLLTMS